MAYVVLARRRAKSGREGRVVEVLEALARASNAPAIPALLDDRDRAFFSTFGGP